MKSRERRHKSIRRKVSGTPECPRLSVYRSLRQIYAQLVDDIHHYTLSAASSLGVKKGTKAEKSKMCGQLLAQVAVKKGITKVVFDRGGYKYHGRVKALAEGAKEAGLKF